MLLKKIYWNELRVIGLNIYGIDLKMIMGQSEWTNDILLTNGNKVITGEYKNIFLWHKIAFKLFCISNFTPIRRGFAPGFVNYKKRCTRLAVASDKVYQLFAYGRWFSPSTLASSTTKTGRHDIAESSIKHIKSNQSIKLYNCFITVQCHVWLMYSFFFTWVLIP
jgi:hypothetical protein